MELGMAAWRTGAFAPRVEQDPSDTQTTSLYIACSLWHGRVVSTFIWVRVWNKTHRQADWISKQQYTKLGNNNTSNLSCPYIYIKLDMRQALYPLRTNGLVLPRCERVARMCTLLCLDGVPCHARIPRPQSGPASCQRTLEKNTQKHVSLKRWKQRQRRWNLRKGPVAMLACGSSHAGCTLTTILACFNDRIVRWF